MHNNYYFLKNLTIQLEGLLIGKSILEIFTQNKNELIMVFKNKSSFFIRANLDPNMCCLSFPQSYERARKNSVNLFDQTYDKEVIGVRQFLNERCFSIYLKEDLQILFKMHGNRSNIILLERGNILQLFKKNLRNDQSIDIDTLDRKLDQSFSAFQDQDGEYKTLFPTFGNRINSYLKKVEYAQLDIADKWKIIQQLLKQLEDSSYYITDDENKVHLSLFKDGNVIASKSNPIDAINYYYLEYSKSYSLNFLKKSALEQLSKTAKRNQNYLDKANRTLNDLKKSIGYRQIGDLVMANLHSIPKNASEVTLLNFYDNNKPIVIKLKKTLTSQKNAENYYRKGKSESLQRANLEENILNKQNELKTVTQHIAFIQCATDFRELKAYLKKHGLLASNQSAANTQKPFRQFEFEGYVICLGRNSKSNDRMLQMHSYKEDLWLHAKHASGSHVLIKHQAGKKYPMSVIEKAASLAAFHSKRNSDTLCPVIYTPRKFVRKRKGDPPGAVVVDKEEVILVSPQDWR